MITHAEARKKWKSDPEHWALYCLNKNDAHEVVERPLSGTAALLQQGWARIKRTYSDEHYNYRVIGITDAGRAELDKATTGDQRCKQ